MELTAALLDLCNSSQKPIIAIDGPAGAGKTTLAGHLTAALSLKYKSATIHMDDLYNGWEAPFDHHLSDALQYACKAHQESKKLSLSFFDWSTNTYGAAHEISSSDLLILEGVGASHRLIRPFLSASIWIDIDPALGVERVLARDGDGISLQMHQWLITQEEHFQSDGTRSSADFELTHP